LREGLLILGALLQFVGIILVGSPDLLPYARRASAWLGRQYRAFVRQVRRRLGLPQTIAGHSGRLTLTARGGMVVDGEATPGASSSVEEWIAYLRGNVDRLREQAKEVERRLTTLERETPKRLERARGEMEAHVESRLAAEREGYRPLRVAGVFALAIGLALLTLGNLA
jgi:hypothetical protein